MVAGIVLNIVILIFKTCIWAGPGRRVSAGAQGGRNTPVSADRCKAVGRVTCFVCLHCSSTGMLSSCGLFLHSTAILQHIAASNACRAVKAGIQTIQVEALTDDVMAGAGGVAGPALDV